MFNRKMEVLFLHHECLKVFEREPHKNYFEVDYDWDLENTFLP